METAAFMRTGEMAKHIGRSKDWLKRRKGTTFRNGVHYHQKPGDPEPFWDVAAMVRWERGERGDVAQKVMEAVLQ